MNEKIYHFMPQYSDSVSIQSFVKWGNKEKNKADGLNDTIDLTTKGEGDA